MENAPHLFAAYVKTTGELSTWVATATFLTASGLFVSFEADMGADRPEIVAWSSFFVVFAAIINALVLVNLLILFFSERDYREYFAIKILILLANVPVLLFYMHHINIR